MSWKIQVEILQENQYTYVVLKILYELETKNILIDPSDFLIKGGSSTAINLVLSLARA